MNREDRTRQAGRRSADGASKPADGRSQGIVRDERGQEQPADKERAQQTSKTEPE